MSSVDRLGQVVKLLRLSATLVRWIAGNEWRRADSPPLFLLAEDIETAAARLEDEIAAAENEVVPLN